MTPAGWVNSCGLVLDIAGAVMIFLFGLPEQLNRQGHHALISEADDEEEKAKAARYDVLGRIGIWLLGTGFVFQLVSNFMK